MKPNIWISSSQAKEMLTKQLATWPLAKKNYEAFKDIQYKLFHFDGFEIKVQFNPSRIQSAGANVNPEFLKERLCFLCPDNLPIEQERLPFGSHYFVLCNPYPIFPEHFTISSRFHEPQSIAGRFSDMLELARRLNEFTIFYNGPYSGASAPDHMHFQAGTRNYMPLDYERKELGKTKLTSILKTKEGEISALKNYLRNGFVIKVKESLGATILFKKVCDALEISKGENEPKMNLFCVYENGEWIITIIPRKKHRPWQFSAMGEEQLLSSPGAADMGGLFIASRPGDFDKLSADLLKDIYQQVALGDEEIDRISMYISNQD